MDREISHLLKVKHVGNIRIGSESRYFESKSHILVFLYASLLTMCFNKSEHLKYYLNE